MTKFSLVRSVHDLRMRCVACCELNFSLSDFYENNLTLFAELLTNIARYSFKGGEVAI